MASTRRGRRAAESTESEEDNQENEVETPEGMFNGGYFLSALKYALSACPKGSDNVALSHIVFTDGRVVGGDGWRWHIGYLPEGAPPFSAFAATRESVQQLAYALECAKKCVGKDGTFFAKMEGAHVTISYDEVDYPIERDLATTVVGAIPSGWQPPVAADAPALFEFPILSPAHVKSATDWKGEGGRVRARGIGGLVRFDIYDQDQMRATAIVLEVGNNAIIPSEEQRLAAQARGGGGVSVLDLQITRQEDGMDEALAALGGEGEFEQPHEDPNYIPRR